MKHVSTVVRIENLMRHKNDWFITWINLNEVTQL